MQIDEELGCPTRPVRCKVHSCAPWVQNVGIPFSCASLPCRFSCHVTSASPSWEKEPSLFRRSSQAALVQFEINGICYVKCDLIKIVLAMQTLTLEHMSNKLPARSTTEFYISKCGPIISELISCERSILSFRCLSPNRSSSSSTCLLLTLSAPSLLPPYALPLSLAISSILLFLSHFHVRLTVGVTKESILGFEVLLLRRSQFRRS